MRANFSMTKEGRRLEYKVRSSMQILKHLEFIQDYKRRETGVSTGIVIIFEICFCFYLYLKITGMSRPEQKRLRKEYAR